MNKSINWDLMKVGALKGLEISGGTSAQITKDCRLFVSILFSDAASKGYKRWPRVLENIEVLNNTVWKMTWQDKNLYTKIMEAKVCGTNKIPIKKQE